MIRMILGTTFVIVALAGLSFWMAGAGHNSQTPQEPHGKAAQKSEIPQRDRNMELKDLPPEAQAALKAYFDDVFAQTPTGHHLSFLHRTPPNTGFTGSWEFRGTGDEVWSNLIVLRGSNIRLANLKFKITKKPITVADKLNKRTEKLLIVVQADSVQGVEWATDGKIKSTAWFDTSRGLDFPKAFLYRWNSGNWTVGSRLIKYYWKKPDESVDISNL